MASTKPKRVYASNVPLNPWSHVRLWLFAGGALSVLYGQARDPQWVESTFVEGFGGQAAYWTAWLTGPLPLSLAELLVGLLLVLELLWMLTGMSEVGAGRRSLANALLGMVAHVVDVALVLGLWFYASWGVAYARPPADQRFDLPVAALEAQSHGMQVALLRESTRLAVMRTNEAYKAVHGSDDAGEVTVPRKGLDVDAALEQAFATMGEHDGLSALFQKRRGQAKAPIAEWILSYLGISGVYVPFTGEATYNDGPPAWAQVMTMAHEKAHQRMVTSEDEASFVGFLACLHSDEPLLRYAAWQFARRQLLGAWAKVEPDRTTGVATQLDPGPQRDIVAVVEFWDGYEGWMADAHEQVNDAYLKANRVEGGVRSYTRASRLLLAWLDTPEGMRAIKGR